MQDGQVDVRRGGDRARTRRPGVDTAHSFSSGHHYDPANTSYGLLVAHDEHVLDAGAGFPSHAHRDIEIVTWVLDGALVHRHATGDGTLVLPGQVQRLDAGRGVVHSETNEAHLLEPARAAAPVRFVQAWVVPDVSGGPPVHERAGVDAARLAEGLVPVASGRAEHLAGTAVRLAQRAAALLVTRLPRGHHVLLPDAPWLHVFVGTGVVALERAGTLGPGDAARLTSAGGQRLTAVEPAEVLVWEMHAALGA